VRLLSPQHVPGDSLILLRVITVTDGRPGGWDLRKQGGDTGGLKGAVLRPAVLLAGSAGAWSSLSLGLIGPRSARPSLGSLRSLVAPRVPLSLPRIKDAYGAAARPLRGP
jgi:hypothetical protein